MEHKSIEYSWKWVTADELLCKVACELVYAVVYTQTADVANYFNLYDGENTLGTPINKFLGVLKFEFAPKAPVYCRRGLYIDKIGTPLGIFVQWREVEHEKREG